MNYLLKLSIRQIGMNYSAAVSPNLGEYREFVNKKLEMLGRCVETELSSLDSDVEQSER